ncbi:hypothetical protein [Apibacter mensalis]|uniref:hypothetical protein n=1 Tax=Apibacter mensalis TaxID=1586267 RepID=UPI0026F0CB32|nr:hypothetical protein [Apibacter mensalis]
MPLILVSYAINFGRIIGTIASVASVYIGGTVLLGIASIVIAIAAIGYIGYQIYKNWDTICDFFLFTGNVITQMATVVWEWTTSIPFTSSPPIDSAWDDAIPAPPPAFPWPDNGKERIDPKVLSKVEDLLKTIALIEVLTRGPWNVYDLHVTNNYEPFNNYTNDRIDKNGIPKYEVYLPLGDIYKYGRTKKASVRARYEESLKHSTNKKDQYILRLIESGKLAPTEWYLYRYNLAVAKALEVALIQGYKAIHGFRPAANPINA